MAYTSIVNEYMRDVRIKIEAALYEAIHNMKKGLEMEISEMAMRRVYDYQASPYFMSQRRYSLENGEGLEPTYDMFSDGMSLTLRETTSLRNGAPNEVEWVEQGIHQGGAGPRPYMDDALISYMASGDAERQLVSALSAYGINATGY